MRTIRGKPLQWPRLDAALLRHRFHWQASRLPRIPTTDQSTCLGPPRLPELLRHTGASGFLRSGTVCHYPGIAWQVELGGPFGHVIGWEPHGLMCLDRARVVGPIGADIKDHHRCGGIPQTAQLRYREAF